MGRSLRLGHKGDAVPPEGASGKYIEKGPEGRSPDPSKLRSSDSNNILVQESPCDSKNLLKLEFGKDPLYTPLFIPPFFGKSRRPLNYQNDRLFQKFFTFSLSFFTNFSMSTDRGSRGWCWTDFGDGCNYLSLVDEPGIEFFVIGAYPCVCMSFVLGEVEKGGEKGGGGGGGPPPPPPPPPPPFGGR